MGKQKEIDDRFKRFGTVSFTAITKVNDFISHLEQGKVMGSRCSQCGKQFFPPRADCSVCLSSDMKWFPVDGPGKLISYSTLTYGPIGFEADLPYSIALVDYGKYKVFGRLSNDIAEGEVKIGMTLKPVPGTTKNGQLSYHFVKA